jgi:hypothetical protein
VSLRTEAADGGFSMSGKSLRPTANPAARSVRRSSACAS